jgi:deazaflavin-dependent oxidoreductase (nitroreductase family)
MLKSIASLALVLIVGLLAVGTVFVLGMRRKWRPVVDLVRRMNLNRLNPQEMETAGQPGAFAGILRHTGRVSGTPYQTPLGILPTDDGFAIALVYGDRTEWLKNVLASGTGSIVYEGESYEVDQPEVVPVADAGVDWPRADRISQALLGVDSAVGFQRVDLGKLATLQ